ncbi:MAG: ROK family protein [Thermodesulfobacteriota bacterium]
MKKNVLGIDIGGTNLRGAVISQNGDVITRDKIASNADKGIDALIETLEKFINKFDKHRLEAIGIGVPGIIDQKSGILTQAPNITGVRNYPLKETLLKKLNSNIPVVIENDANCAALGEYWMGVCRNKSISMIMLTIGTGLGGGIIINDRLWAGKDGMGGEIGHMTINYGGPLCNCGSLGCLETYASANAVRRMVIENSELAKKIVRIKKENVPKAIMDLAAKGNINAKNLWKDFGRNLGIGIANLVNILNIEIVVIGGGLSNAWAFFIKDTKKEVKKRALRAPGERLKIKKAVLGDDAGIFGACYLAMKKLKEV